MGDFVTTDASGFLSGVEPGSDVIALTFPADTRWVRLARLLTSGVAAQAGFDVEEVEDLKIAVDEICATLMERSVPTEPVRLAFRPSGGSVEVVIESAVASTSGDSWTEERMKLSEQILSVVVDECHSEVSDGVVRYRLVKTHLDVAEGEADGG
ncbi:MAG: putative anti-sigma factor [Acidimicrobiia bacterium]|nr:putative anti-sigma factor [Acidimicrobiia bacterium]